MNQDRPLSRHLSMAGISACTVAMAAMLALPAAGEPTGGPAEYAFRWNSLPGRGPSNIGAAAELLGTSKKDDTLYLVQYREARRPNGLPDAVRLITRQRTEQSGPDAGKVESTYKLRASAPLTGLAPAEKFPCLLKSAAWEGELDVSWSLKQAAAGPSPTSSAAAAATLVVTEVHSRTCSVKMLLETALPPQALLDSASNKCAVKMVRYRDDVKKLKVEEWGMPSGEVLLEVSRKVKKDTAQARADFEAKVVQPLLNAGAVPSKEDKTELAKCT